MNLTRLESGAFMCPDDPGEPGYKTPRVSIAPDEAPLLTAFAKGKRVLEIGTGLGVSTRALAASAIEVWTADIDSWVHENIWPHLPNNVVGLVQTSSKYDAGAFDVVFIDGHHEIASVMADLEIALAALSIRDMKSPRVIQGGLIVLHDIAGGHVPAALAKMGLRWHGIETTFGLGVVVV